MSEYLFTSQELKKLAGARFGLPNLAGGAHVPFDIAHPTPGWPRCGVEAYAALVTCNHPQIGPLPSVLKVFKFDLPERHQRTRHLINLGLAKHHPWLFSAVPYAALPSVAINGVALSGHIAKRVGGGHASEDISRLRSEEAWKFGDEDRRALAAHLCSAVTVLEGLGIVHGDISPGNVMIAPVTSTGAVAAILCDYDGFFHPSVPLLPSSTPGGMACRPAGTAGFQYPDLLLRRSDPSVYVETDRFALAAMVCEIMAWESPGDSERLVRETLLDDAIIEGRDVGALGRDILDRFPEGFALLQRALESNGHAQMPSPADWAEVLGVDTVGEASFKARPVVEISRVTRGREPATACLTSDSGNFSQINASLAAVQFLVSGGAVEVTIQWKDPILRVRRGRQTTVGIGPRTVRVRPGDMLVSNQWKFCFSDGGEAT